jgi:hypothetical protein
MKKFILLMLTINLFNNLNAQGKYTLKFGMSYSNFIGEKREHEPRFVLGFGREWPLVRNTVIVGEINFFQQRNNLKNKTIGSSDTSFIETSLETYNIHCVLMKIVMPIIIRQYFNIGEKLKIYLQTGLFINISTKDKSYNELLYSNPNIGLKKVKYDYRTTTMNQNGSYQGTVCNFGFGLGVTWSKFQLESRYQIQYIDWFNFICINKKIEFYQLILGLNL